MSVEQHQAKVAVVTGSGKKRVGKTIAERLARRGYSLVIHYRTSEQEAHDTVAALRQSFGVQVIAVQADLSQEHEVRRLVNQIGEHFDRIDVLVNAAAIWQPKKLEDITAADLEQNFRVNALSTFLCCQQLGLKMVAQPEGGVIINIGDWAEIRPYLDYAAYFPSKGAVTVITRTLAVELATRNPRVRVNQVSPGPVMLPEDLPKAERDEAINATLVKREGSPNNIADAVMMFIDNDFTTGVILPVDGGRSIYAP